MSSAAGPDVGLIQSIIQTYVGGTVERIVDCSPGYSGSFVYAVDVVSPTGQLPCIVKLIPDWPDDAEVTNRVYGSRAASFRTVYALLQQHAIPLPRLYATLAPQPELPFYCYVMERLHGDDVQTIRARLSGTAQAHLDAMIGRHLGIAMQRPLPNGAASFRISLHPAIMYRRRLPAASSRESQGIHARSSCR